MAAVLIALFGAVLTVIGYVALTDRLDYSTVHRRQLDTWAAVMAIAWLSGIVYGGVDVRLAASSLPATAPNPGVVPVLIPRLTPPALFIQEGQPAPQPESSDHARVVKLDAAPLPMATTVALLPEPAFAEDGPDDDAGLSSRPAFPVPGRVDPAPAAMPLAEPTQPVLLVPLPGHPLAPSPGPSVTRIAMFVPTIVPRMPASPTPRPPTAVPTEPPVEPAQPTPNCGDPHAIKMAVRIVEAEAEERENELLVRYRAEVTNNATFPVTLADIEVSALNRGSERFGTDSLPNMLVQPGDTVPLEGSVTLTKRPSPITRTDLCLSFVGETCGRRDTFNNVIRRCQVVSGF